VKPERGSRRATAFARPSLFPPFVRGAGGVSSCILDRPRATFPAAFPRTHGAYAPGPPSILHPPFLDPPPPVRHGTRLRLAAKRSVFICHPQLSPSCSRAAKPN
jgi:hypothetical protein